MKDNQTETYKLNMFYDRYIDGEVKHYLQTVSYTDALHCIQKIIEQGGFNINYDVYKKVKDSKYYEYKGNVKIGANNV